MIIQVSVIGLSDFGRRLFNYDWRRVSSFSFDLLLVFGDSALLPNECFLLPEDLGYCLIDVELKLVEVTEAETDLLTTIRRLEARVAV